MSFTHRSLLFALAVASTMHAVSFQRSASPPAPKVFSTKKLDLTPPREVNGPGIKRVRAVTLVTDVFTNRKAPIDTDMNFFSDVDLIVHWTRVEKVTQPAGLV